MEKPQPRRLDWLDTLKGIAILAVMADHYYGMHRVVFTQPLRHLFFAVPWFIFLAGVTSALSFSKTNGIFAVRTIGFFRKRIPLMAAYAVSTVFFAFVSSGGVPTWPVLGMHLLAFDAIPPMYYLYLLFSLYLLTPVFFVILTRIRKPVMRFGAFIVLAVIGWICAQQSRGGYPWLTYPWKLLLGGTYIPVYFAGMSFFLYGKRIARFIPLVFIPILIAYELVLFPSGAVPLTVEPGYFRMAWAISLLMVAYLAIRRIPEPVTRVLGFLGKNSLVIFLFHEWCYYRIRPFAAIDASLVATVAVSLVACIALGIAVSALRRLPILLLGGKSAHRDTEPAWYTRRYPMIETLAVLAITVFFACINMSGVIAAWFARVPGTVFIGITHWYEDYFAYVSEVTQGMRGSWLAVNPYSTEQVPQSTNWMFNVLLGRLTSWTGLPPWTVYDWSLFLSSIVLMLFMYFILKKLFPENRFLRIAGFLIALSSSCLYRISVSGSNIQIIPIDFFFTPTLSLNRLGGGVHQMLTHIFTLATIASVAYMAQWELRKPRGRRIGKIGLTPEILRWGMTAAFAVAAASLFINNAVTAAVTVACAGAGAGISILLGKKFRALAPFVFRFIAGILPLGVLGMMSRETFSHWFYKYMVAWEANTPPTDARTLFLSTGLILPFAIPGAVAVFRKKTPLAVIGVLTAFVPFILYLSPVPRLLGFPYNRILMPMQWLFLGAMAGWTMLAIPRLAKRLIPALSPLPVSATLLAVYLLIQAPMVWTESRGRVLGNGQIAFMNNFDRQAYDGLMALGAIPGDTTAIAPYPVSLMVPMISGHRSYAAHGLLTVGIGPKYKDVNDILSMAKPPEEARAFMRQNGIGFVVLTAPRTPNQENFMKAYPFLKPVYASEGFAVFGLR